VEVSSGWTICKSLAQTGDRACTSSLNFSTGRMLFLTPNQQCQSTEGTDGQLEVSPLWNFWFTAK